MARRNGGVKGEPDTYVSWYLSPPEAAPMGNGPGFPLPVKGRGYSVVKPA